MQELFRAIHVGDEEEIEKAARKEIEKLHKNAKTIGQYQPCYHGDRKRLL